MKNTDSDKLDATAKRLTRNGRDYAAALQLAVKFPDLADETSAVSRAQTESDATGKEMWLCLSRIAVEDEASAKKKPPPASPAPATAPVAAKPATPVQKPAPATPREPLLPPFAMPPHVHRDAALPHLDRLMMLDAESLRRAFVNVSNGNSVAGKQAMVSIVGPLSQRAGGWDGYDAVVERFKAAMVDPSVGGVLLRIDSPGGAVAGCFAAVSELRAAKRKPVVAYVDETCCSAAYALATIADKIVLPPSGRVGSIGVIATAVDLSTSLASQGIRVAVVTSGARKADGHPAVPMSAEQIKRLQSDVDTVAAMFFDLVAKARGMSAADVKALDAATFTGSAAVRSRLADSTGGLDDARRLLSTLN